MKNLWTILPPFLADTFGLMDTVSNTDGLVLIDDSAGYKNMPTMDGRDVRMICSDIRMEDVINGTKKKILSAWRRQGAEFSPAFVILCAAPASSMIGTDLDDAAEEIARMGGIPAAAVNISGHKTYDNGVSKAQEAMAKLLLKQQETVDGSFNVIGENGIDRSRQSADELFRWLLLQGKERGLSVMTRWCMESSAHELESASAASVNLVTTVSGLAAAKYMKNVYGIPYIAAVPFGKTWGSMVMDALKTGVQPCIKEHAEESPKVLVIGEQFMANAVRATLKLDYGMSGIQVASFFMMEKSLMQAKDKRLKCEDDLKQLIGSGDYKIIIGDELFKTFVPEHVKFISYPCRAFIMPADEEDHMLAGDYLNNWMDERI